MNENLNLIEILKDCPKGTKLYSTVYGEVEFDRINKREDFPVRFVKSDGDIGSVTAQGLVLACYDGECILFPSREQRDWSKFKVKKPKFKVGDRIRHKETNKDDVYEISKVYDDSYGIAGFTWMIYKKYQDQYELVPNKFDPNTLKPFDKVLARDSEDTRWRCTFYSHSIESVERLSDLYKYVTTTKNYKCCIPYNEETKHLVGTKDEAPEYYRYWEV